jgi:hypothetical protein
MAGELITSFFAQPFIIDTSYACTTTDSRGGPTARTFLAGYYRIFLTPTTGAGTSLTDPKEFLAYVRSILGAAFWNVQMTATGRVKITYLSTGTGTITWGGGGSVVRNILGFTGDIGPLAQNASSTATNQPTHCMLICSRANDTGWQDEEAGAAGAVFPDGQSDYLGDGYVLNRRSYTLSRLPRTATEVTQLGSNVTPMWPIDTATSRRKTPISTPATVPSSTATVWSVSEFIANAMGNRVAITHGDFQTIVAGTTHTYDICSLDPKTRAAKAVHSVAYWKARMDRPGFEVLLYDGNGTTA